MSDSVLMSQSSPASLVPLNSSAQTLVLKEVPPELLKLPAGTVLSAQVVPSEGKNGVSVLNVSMPDGSIVVFETKTAFPDNTNATINFKITGTQGTDALLVRINSPFVSKSPEFSTPTPESLSVAENSVITTQSVLNGTFLKNVPETVRKILPSLSLTQTVPEGTKISFNLIPEDKTSITNKAAADVYANSVPSNSPFPEKTPVSETANSVAGLPEKNMDNGNATPLLSKIENVSEPVKTSGMPANNPALKDFVEKTFEVKTTTPENILKTPANIPDNMNERPAAVQQTTVLTQQTGEFVPQKTTNVPPVSENVSPTPVPAESKNLSAATVPPSVIEKGNVPSAERQNVSFIPNEPTVSVPKIPETITGFFIQPEASEPPVIASDFGVLAVEQKITLPHLSALSLKIVSLDMPAEPVLRAENLPDSPWAFLNDAIESLRQSAPEAVDALLAVLPKTGNKLPSLMLSFMNAVNTGQDVRAWLGETNVQALKAMGKRGEAVLKNFEKEFSRNVKKGSDGKSVWKGYDIPFMTGTAVEPVSLYLQQSSEALEERSKNKPRPASAVRFVLDLNLTKLGRLQLEGLAQRSDKTFHLNIRHIYPLDADFENNIRTIFSKTLDALHYTGVCSFKRTNDFIEIRPEKSDQTSLKNGVWA